MWDVIVFIPDHCLSIYFPISNFKSNVFYLRWWFVVDRILQMNQKKKKKKKKKMKKNKFSLKLAVFLLLMFPTVLYKKRLRV